MNVVKVQPAGRYRYSLTAPRRLAPMILCMGLAALAASIAEAHSGRRFVVSVDSDQIVARGANTGTDDGAPAVRPYLGAIHDHWQNSPLGLDSASASFPEFDVPGPTSALANWPLRLTLHAVTTWRDPPHMPSAGTVPQLAPLSAGEIVSVTLDGETVDSSSPGTLLLASSVLAEGVLDISLLYEVNQRPSNQIHVVEVALSSGNPAIGDSDSLYVILSPDGATPVERLHHASLFLENYLASARPVPEPGGGILLAGFGLLVIACAVLRRGGRT